MEEEKSNIANLCAQGNCCAQVMVGMGLIARGEENERLMDAVSALCGGLQKGLLCGALSGAACLMSMFDKASAANDMIPELVDWFEAEYGSVNCEEITGGKENRPAICPNLIERTFFEAKEIMNSFGIDI